MQILIRNISVGYPNEQNDKLRNLIIENETIVLQFNFACSSDGKRGGFSLKKEEVEQLRDALDLF